MNHPGWKTPQQSFPSPAWCAVALLAATFLALPACDNGGQHLSGDDVDAEPPDGAEAGAEADADARVEAEVEAAADADADGDVDADADVGADGDADADADADADCGAECLAGLRTACTCAASDPCGWAGDTICDTRRCERDFGAGFDDGTDCDTRENCGGDCSAGAFNACTCDPRDPCRREPDGICDTPECEAAVPGGPIYDDSADCIGAACDGACRETRQDACTCDPADPCVWAGDGFCDDDACEAIVPGAHFDDSADCGATPGTLTFAATSVVNELDRNDMYVMAEGLVGLGYSWVVRDADVSTAELTSYLEMDLTTLYHTSHGNDGVVATSDGTLARDAVTLAVHNTIFATCLTLVPPWNSAFGPTAETVLGYTDVSYDYIDDDVVREMLVRLGAGDSYILAWYQGNIAVSGLEDRWAGYVREGTEIVEYSARSGVIPLAVLPDGVTWVPLAPGGRLWASSTLLAGTRPFDAVPRLLAVGRDAGRTAGALPGGWALLAPTEATDDDALAGARAFVDAELGGLPDDAAFAGATPVFARREGRAGELIGWAVRWSRELDDVPLRGNGVADHVIVLVGPAGAVAWSSWWPERLDAPASAPAAELLFDAGAALRAAASELSRSVKGELRLRDARPVLGTLGPGRGGAVPAWEYDDGRGATVVIDALTGRVLR